MFVNAVKLTREKKKPLALLAATAALSLMLLDGAAFSVILPTVQEYLVMSAEKQRWLLNAYYLTSAAFVLLGGKLADITGPRRILIIGFILFGLANLVFGLSTSYSPMLFARILQGLAAALIGPAGFRVLVDRFPQKERGSAIGISSGISSVFLVIGPFLAGILTEFYTWRAISLLYLPIAIFGIVGCAGGLTDYRKKGETIDLMGLLLSSCGILLLISGLMQLSATKGFSDRIISLFGGSILFFVLLYFRSSYGKSPFFDFALFKNAQFNAGLFVVMLTSLIMVNPYFWSTFLQRSLFLPPVEAASYIVISAIPAVVIAPASGLIADKRGAQTPIFLGFFAILISVFSMMLFCLYQSISFMILALCCYGCGTSLILTPLGNIAMTNVPESLRGFASGVYMTARFLGSSIGIALLGAAFQHSRANSFGYLSEHQFGKELYSIKDIFSILSSEASDLGPQMMSALRLIYTNSSLAGISAINVCNGFITIIALVLTLVYLKDYTQNKV